MAKFKPLLDAGWEVIPLAREGGKKPLVDGHHGADHKVADEETVKGWAKRYPDCNPAIVMPPGVLGLDVDNHDVDGLEAILEFQRLHGTLPEGPHIFHGYASGGRPSPYGTYLFRVPEECLDRFGPRMIVGNLNKVAGPGVDVIAPWLRYNVAPGAVHKTGETYEWAIGDEVLPMCTPDMVPMLTVAQFEALLSRRAVKQIESAEPAASSHGVKPIVSAEHESIDDQGKRLLRQTRQLALLPEGESLFIEGQERGWQRGDGFYVLACALVRVARIAGKDLERIKASFVKAAYADGRGLDDMEAERQFENAMLAVEEDDEIEAGDGPYSVAISQEPYVFTTEMIERHWMLDGVLTLRFRHDDRTFWLWHDRKRRYDHLTEDDLFATIKRTVLGGMETFMTEDGPEYRRIKVNERITSEIAKHLASLTLTSEYGAGALLPSVGGVPFRNGWLDVETGELVPIGPERDVRWNVPADYDPLAECPEWLAFLDSLGWTEGSEERRLIQQWLGYLLSGRKDQERGLLMLGPTRSGKGTIIHVAHALLGEGAVGTTLASLTQNFGLQSMIGKGLATIGDARFGRSDKALNGVLLSLTSNDPLPVDVKYGKPLSINLPVRLMIATNETPNFIEASDALGMRFVVLKFTESFIGREDRELGKRLMGELPGIARWALDGLRDLEEVGKFSETTAGRSVQKQMITESAFVRLFVEECCELGSGFTETNEKLYAEYSTWATQNGMPVYNSVKFSRELLDAFPANIENTNMKRGGKSVRGKNGVRLA